MKMEYFSTKFLTETNKTEISRRDFMKLVGSLTAAAAAGSLLPRRLEGAGPSPAETPFDLLVVEGKDYPKLIETALDRLGFPSMMLKPGQKVVIKPNAAWSRTPEQAANTNPVLISALIGACRKAKASEVLVGRASLR